MTLTFIKKSWDWFCAEDSGTVSVEFVVVLPLLLWWYAGSFVFFDAFRDYNSTEKATYTISDILSRQKVIDNNYIDGMESLLKYMTASGPGAWMRVTSVKFTTDIGYTVEWSYGTDGHAALTTAQLQSFKVDEEFLPTMGSGETVIFLETSVPYTPAFKVGLSARDLTNVNVTRPRFASQIVNESF